MKQHGECIIKNFDWMNLTNKIGSSEIAMLTLLKSKGAPILGMLELKPDMENYIWYHEEDIMKNAIRVAWKPIKQEKEK